MSRIPVPRTTRRQLIGGAAASTLAARGAMPALARQASGGHAQAVVSSDHAATEAGMAMLAQGGSAADAAIAVAAVLTVVEPWFSSVLGGGTWALYYEAATSEVAALDGVGPVGSKATLADYRRRAGDPGMHQAIVPGAWDGWMRWLARYGRLDLGDILAPAIALARDGHEASKEMIEWLGRRRDEVLAFPETARIYAPDDELIEEGDTVRQEDLAATFETLVAAYDGARGDSREAAIQAARNAFYRGPIAEAIIAYSDANDGYLTLDDFAGFEAEIVAPIIADYRDVTVCQCPPNSQGITMLLALEILEGFDLAALDPASPDAIHLQVEAIKLAFADRYRYIGDPDRIDIPIEELLSAEHAAEQREKIAMDRAIEWTDEAAHTAGRHHTTTFHIVDAEGNAAGVTTSLGAQFLVVGDTGIHINERMGFLSLEEGNANQLTPGYKVRHTSCPYMAFRDGRLYICGGNTGVDTQPQGQVQQVVNIVDFGMSAEEAVEQPRFVSTAFPATTHPYAVENTLQMQAGTRGSVVADLRERGHDVTLGEGTFGSANILVVSPDGREIEAGAEPSMSRSAAEVIPADG